MTTYTLANSRGHGQSVTEKDLVELKIFDALNFQSAEDLPDGTEFARATVEGVVVTVYREVSEAKVEPA